jgi:hypothetical protein
MNKIILTLFFVLMLGFPRVSNGQLFGKDKNYDEFSLRCEGEGIKIPIFIRINLKNKTISLYPDTWNDSTEFITTMVNDGFINGRRSGSDKGTKLYHHIFINRYSGRVVVNYWCKNQTVSDEVEGV